MRTSIIIPLYIGKWTEQMNWTLQYYNCLGARHEVVVIDDCSEASIPFKNYPQIKFARIQTSIEWNQPGARNLGAHISSGDDLFFIDIDHLAPIYFDRPYQGVSTIFPRIYNGKEILPNQGVVLLRREDFKGYDEDFCGNYGKDDSFFIKIHGKRTAPNDTVIVLNTPNANSLTPRDSSLNQKLFTKKIDMLKKGVYKAPKQLNFIWTEL